MSDVGEPIDHVLFHVRDALATDARVGELGLEVTCVDDVVTVRGLVSTEHRRSQIVVVATEVLTQHQSAFAVVNDTEVTLVDETDARSHEPERL